MVDCYMSLNVQYAVEMATKAKEEGIDITWWEEVSSYAQEERVRR